jgi:hypothetical protein
VPIQTDAPSGIGAQSDWALWGSAANKLAAVATDDGDTSVIYAASGGALKTELFTFPSLLGVTTPVNAATLVCRVREALPGAGGRGFSALWNSVQDGTNWQATVHAARPSYVTITFSAAGGQLALTAVNGQHGWVFTAAGGPTNKAEFWITQTYRTVDFTYQTGSAGEFADLIGSIALVIGGGLLLAEMPKLSAYLHKCRRIRLKPDEYEPAWRAWTNLRHRVYA